MMLGSADGSRRARWPAHSARKVPRGMVVVRPALEHPWPMSEGTSVTDRALTTSLLLVGAVVVGVAAKVWLKRWREAVINP